MLSRIAVHGQNTETGLIPRDGSEFRSSIPIYITNGTIKNLALTCPLSHPDPQRIALQLQKQLNSNFRAGVVRRPYWSSTLHPTYTAGSREDMQVGLQRFLGGDSGGLWTLRVSEAMPLPGRAPMNFNGWSIDLDIEVDTKKICGITEINRPFADLDRIYGTIFMPKMASNPVVQTVKWTVELDHSGEVIFQAQLVSPTLKYFSSTSVSTPNSVGRFTQTFSSPYYAGQPVEGPWVVMFECAMASVGKGVVKKLGLEIESNV
jgi:hypothetical protein